jgi:hypothetical protein
MRSSDLWFLLVNNLLIVAAGRRRVQAAGPLRHLLRDQRCHADRASQAPLMMQSVQLIARCRTVLSTPTGDRGLHCCWAVCRRMGQARARACWRRRYQGSARPPLCRRRRRRRGDRTPQRRADARPARPAAGPAGGRALIAAHASGTATSDRCERVAVTGRPGDDGATGRGPCARTRACEHGAGNRQLSGRTPLIQAVARPRRRASRRTGPGGRGRSRRVLRLACGESAKP